MVRVESGHVTLPRAAWGRALVALCNKSNHSEWSDLIWTFNSARRVHYYHQSQNMFSFLIITFHYIKTTLLTNYIKIIQEANIFHKKKKISNIKICFQTRGETIWMRKD